MAAGAEFVRGDIRNPADLEQVAGPVDLMFECGAEPSVLGGIAGNDAGFMAQNNRVGSPPCFEFARKRKVAAILLSTARAYPYDARNRQAYREKAVALQRDETGVGNHAAEVRPAMRSAGRHHPLRGRGNWASGARASWPMG